MPGGAAQARRWDTQVEFDTSSKFVAWVGVPPSATPHFLIYVNGKMVSPSFSVSLTAGSTGYVQLEFPDRRPRKVKWVFSGGNPVLRFETEAAYPPTRTASAGKILAAIGDSLTAGAGTPPDYSSALDTWIVTCAAMLGFDHALNAGIGGTFWTPSGAGDVAVSHFGGGRLPLVQGLAPEALAYAGSRNDPSADAIRIAVEAALDATTITKRFVMGTFTSLSKNAYVQTGAINKGVPFIGMTDGLQAGDLGVDGIHNTYQGGINLAMRMVPRLYAAGCRP
jgi:hypothetical protein